ncbi:MAG TPA: DinB family protein [Chloroflexota bacterium]|nr:DinB family protein [Chloroflexota bacterium]
MQITADPVAILRANLSDAHWLLEQVVDGVTDQHLHWHPPGTANTIAATYAHVVANEDLFVQETLQGRKPLAEGEWSDRDGISLPVPRRGADWFAWSRRVRVDVAAARAYAAAVYSASDVYLARLAPQDLVRAPDVPLPGNQTLSWLLHNLLVQHAALHSGEIAVLRGLQGLQGLP